MTMREANCPLSSTNLGQILEKISVETRPYLRLAPTLTLNVVNIESSTFFLKVGALTVKNEKNIWLVLSVKIAFH